MNCGEFQSILASEPLNILEEQERVDLEAHRSKCDGCRVLSKEIAAAYELLGDKSDEDAFNPDDLWSGIKQGLESPQRPSGPVTVIQKSRKTIVIALSCSYCHDSLARGEASYCASCLAPHHTDCFQSHGRCSAMGCEETLTVKPMSAGHEAPKQRTRSTAQGSRRVFLSVVGLIGLGTLATVGLVGQEYILSQRRAEARQRAATLVAIAEADDARKTAEKALQAQRLAELAREVQERQREVDREVKKLASITARTPRKEQVIQEKNKIKVLQDLRSRSLALEEALKRAKESEAKLYKLSKAELESEQVRSKELEEAREKLEAQQLELRQQVQELMAKMPPIEIWKSRYEKKIISFKVEKMNFLDALFELEKIVDLSIDVHPDQSYPVISCDARHRPWQEVLEAMVRKAGAELEYVSPRCISIRPARLSTQSQPEETRQQRLLELSRQLDKNIIVCPDVTGSVPKIEKNRSLFSDLESSARKNFVYRMGDTRIVSQKSLRLPLEKDYEAPIHPFVMRAEISSLSTASMSDTVTRLCQRLSHESGGVEIKVLSRRDPKVKLRVRKVTWRELLLLLAHKGQMKIYESPDVITLVDNDSAFVEANEAPIRLIIEGLNQLSKRQCLIDANITGHVSLSLRSNTSQSFLNKLCEAFELGSRRMNVAAKHPFTGPIIRYSKATPNRPNTQRSNEKETVVSLRLRKSVKLLLQAVLGRQDQDGMKLAIISGRLYKIGDPIVDAAGDPIPDLRVSAITKNTVELEEIRREVFQSGLTRNGGKLTSVFTKLSLTSHR